MSAALVKVILTALAAVLVVGVSMSLPDLAIDPITFDIHTQEAGR